MSKILIKPVITEKATRKAEVPDTKKKTYVFRVSRDANKIEIKKAVEATYNVNVEAVNTTVNPGKAKVRYTKRGIAAGVKSAYKKAYVTLQKGESIDFYGSV
ncbi:MAG: 50S ribosomal protein L23 [Chitinophagales bacterium]|nr:50S ribosomal protein L23 [Chitinophagales bacterium]MDW8420069.1 50S ribosomal protein L23 [Chitinophagales bacterium]